MVANLQQSKNDGIRLPPCSLPYVDLMFDGPAHAALFRLFSWGMSAFTADLRRVSFEIMHVLDLVFLNSYVTDDDVWMSSRYVPGRCFCHFPSVRSNC